MSPASSSLPLFDGKPYRCNSTLKTGGVVTNKNQKQNCIISDLSAEEHLRQEQDLFLPADQGGKIVQ
jgi:hypothetical protein